jgi:hypothetical protein
MYSDPRFFEIALVLMRCDHVAGFILNANHCIMQTAAVFGVSDSVRDGVWPGVPQPTERQRIGDEINAALVFARADFVNVHSAQRRPL